MHLDLNAKNRLPLVVGIGEALFDIFPDRRVLGGAPLNVVVHAAQLGQLFSVRSTIVSRIGNDPMGQEAQSALELAGVNCQWLQTDESLPTGTVRVNLEAGQPTYTIVTDSAWDAIEWSEDLEALAVACQAVCFGTLAQRCTKSQTTIRHFLKSATQAIRLLDVNFRPPFVNDELILESCRLANMIKCNEQELPILSNLFSLPEYVGRDDKRIMSSASRLRHRMSIDTLMLTRGEQGCTLFTEEGTFIGESVAMQSEQNADGVGAGDATAAVLLIGTLKGWDPQRIVNIANWMGAYVNSRSGATPLLTPKHLLALRNLIAA